MRPGCVKIVEKLWISRNFESSETELCLAEKACWVDYANTRLLKQVHQLSKSKRSNGSTTHYGCENTVEFDNGELWATLSMPKISQNGSSIQYTVVTNYFSQHRMNRPSWSKSWKCWGHSVSGPCECQRAIQLLCIMLSLSTMTFSIIWMALCDFFWKRWLNGVKTCT